VTERSAAARFLRLWVRILSGARMFVSCVYSDGMITHPEQSYRMWCIFVCDLETSIMNRLWPTLGGSAKKKGGGDGLDA
jgi:hypothetical protein